jgi:ubiquitin-like protein Pup
MRQVQKTVQGKTQDKSDEAAVEDETPIGGESADLSETDSMLEEIDSVLEVNAAEFIRQFVQKGGQIVTVLLERGLACLTFPRLTIMTR